MKNSKILHVMPDSVFTDIAIRQLEATNSYRNEYCVFSKVKKYTKSTSAFMCERREIDERLSRDDVLAVVFHSLPEKWYSLLQSVPPEIVTVWIGWGYDYYTLGGSRCVKNLVLPRTSALLKKNISISTKLRSAIGALRRRIANRVLYSSRCLNRLSYFSPVLDVEYPMVKSRIELGLSRSSSAVP